jgi:pyruvate,water dikinase
LDPFVLTLLTLRPEDAPLVGGKAAKLGELLSARFPVPSGICLTTAAFRTWVAPCQEQIANILSRPGLTDPARAREAADEIAVLLEDRGVPPSVEEALSAALSARVATAPLAVRSSSTAEDRADASFAGQYETVLGVRGRSAISDAVLVCWRSFFSPHALVARASAHALAGDEAMALLLQDMVEAECSGVAFSVDPVRPESGLLVVNAAWGLGTGVVDSQAATDTYRVRRTDLRTEERHIVEKPEKVGLSPQGGLRLEPVPDERRRAACLPERWLRRIAQFTIAAENGLGGPQDVEWAIGEEQVWILQSRPVTALPSGFSFGSPFPLSEEHRTGPLWEINGSSRRRVPLPLDLDTEAIRTAAMAEALLLNGSTRGGRLEVEVRKRVNGRVYTRSVPSDLHSGDGRIRKNASSDLGHRLRESDVTLWEYYAPEIVKTTERLSKFDLSTDDGPALAGHLEDALGAYRRHWALHFALPDGRTFYEPFLEAFARLSGCAKEEAREASFPLLEGAGNMLTQLIDGLYDLACAARGTSAEAVLTGIEPGGLERLESLPDTGPFRKALDAFLAVYGDRSGLGVGSEPALHVPTWREEPELVFPMIASYLTSGVEAPETLRRRMNAERDRQAEALGRSDDREAASVFLGWLPLMRRARTDLENHNHYIDQMSVGQLRAAILASSRLLVDRRVIAAQNDIFWLYREEITQALRESSPTPLRQTVAQRKLEWKAWEQMAPPPILGLPEKRLEPRPSYQDEVTVEAIPEAGVIRGEGASSGKVRGRARVIPSGIQLPDVAPGEILVAETAGPEWTPLFPILGGLILSRAALFHHAATTAREYGIPAVINVKGCTLRIPDGAWITLDGTTGEVTVEPEESREHG